MYSLNILACAIGGNYERFLIPFYLFALLHNTNTHVELVVKDKDAFLHRYEKELDAVISIVGSHFILRNFQKPFNKHMYNTYRFFEIPSIEAEYTYIIDIDIMILESVLEIYRDNWLNDMVYSNVLRYKNSSRLTGVHMVKTKEYYTEQYKELINKYYNHNNNENDEVILGIMCKVCHGMPLPTYRFRPILGIHFSPNRSKTSAVPLLTYKIYYDKFMIIKDRYPHLFEFHIFKQLYNSLKTQFNIRNTPDDYNLRIQ